MRPSPVDFDVVVRSGVLRARRWGSPVAPLAIGVPGLTGNVENVAFLAERLAGADLQVVAVDLRGRGHSTVSPLGTYGWERHARDVFTVADSLGVTRFAIVGMSMGASVAMMAAELDGSRLRAVVLVDVAGRVDPGVGPVIAESLTRLGRVHESPEQYLDAVRASGLIDPWSDHWERAFRYDLSEVDGGVRCRTSPDAVAEDRSYTATQHPYARWAHLTMPTLLVRARREIRPGAGHVVPVDDRDRFRRGVPHGEVVEIDANHLTVTTHPDLAPAVHTFLRRATA